jgi:hypothetical protein
VKRIIPLVGSNVANLIGIVHLPRLWLKALLASVDALPDGYHSATRGFDTKLMEHFHLERDEFVAFLNTRPTYLECEGWVREHASHLDEAGLGEWNRTVNDSLRTEEKALEACANLGVAGIRSTVMLDSLDDWQAVHAHALENRGERIVPAISSASVGPLGAKHLPRFWLKALLKAVDALPEGWRTGPGLPGIDATTFEILAIDGPAFVAYIESTLPTYVQFETWLREHAGKLDPESIAQHNEKVVRNKPDEHGIPERAELGISDPSVRKNQFINDLLDWKALHEQIITLAHSARN